MDLLTDLTAWGQVGQVYTKPAKISFSTIFCSPSTPGCSISLMFRSLTEACMPAKYPHSHPKS